MVLLSLSTNSLGLLFSSLQHLSLLTYLTDTFYLFAYLYIPWERGEISVWVIISLFLNKVFPPALSKRQIFNECKLNVGWMDGWMTGRWRGGWRNEFV